MKLFNLFKKKNIINDNVILNEEKAEVPKAEVHIIEEPQMVKVKCIRSVTLAKEYKKIKVGDILELTEDRAKELQEKGFIKIIGG